MAYIFEENMWVWMRNVISAVVEQYECRLVEYVYRESWRCETIQCTNWIPLLRDVGSKMSQPKRTAITITMHRAESYSWVGGYCNERCCLPRSFRANPFLHVVFVTKFQLITRNKDVCWRESVFCFRCSIFHCKRKSSTPNPVRTEKKEFVLRTTGVAPYSTWCDIDESRDSIQIAWFSWRIGKLLPMRWAEGEHALWLTVDENEMKSQNQPGADWHQCKATPTFNWNSRLSK